MDQGEARPRVGLGDQINTVLDTAALLEKVLIDAESCEDAWTLLPSAPASTPSPAALSIPPSSLPVPTLHLLGPVMSATLALQPLLFTPSPAAPGATSSSSAPSPRPDSLQSKARLHAKQGKAARRRKKRHAEPGTPFSRKVKSSASKYVTAAKQLQSSIETISLPIARGAFEGVSRPTSKKVWTVEELMAEGFTYIAWDGIKPITILDKDRRVVALLAGQPRDPSWGAVAAEASAAMEEAYQTSHFTSSQQDHRRGKFSTLAHGFSHGGGRTAPGKIHNSAKSARALHKLCKNKAMSRIAGFGSNMLATYAPRLHASMSDTVQKILDHYPDLQLNFKTSIYPAASFNFGPSTVCYPHTDAANDACNWCHITALGTFDPCVGGHIIIFEARLVIEFPSASSIFIPSALVTHGNVPIQAHERRQSFTQYCAGSLARWVECGFQSLDGFGREDPEGKKVFEASRAARVAASVQRFSTIDELVESFVKE